MDSHRQSKIDRIKKFLKKKRNVIVSIVLGQILSLFICGTAITSAYISMINVNIPLSQSFLNYALIGMIYTSVFVYKQNMKVMKVVKDRGWIYLLAAVVDVEANYAIVKAYQYTSVTSVQLLDCLTIPTVVVLSLVVFSLRYRWSHYVAVIICLCGAVTMVLVDYFLNNQSASGSNALLGDILVVVGAMLYGVSNVFQDFMVKNHGQVEYLAFIGFFGSIVGALQILILEKSELTSALLLHYHQTLFWSSMSGFVLSMFLLYSLMPYVMRISSSVVTNLSLLTADVYALIVGIFIFGYKFHFLYFLAYVLIMVGVGLFVSKEAVYLEEGLTLDLWCKKSICCKRRSSDEESGNELPLRADLANV